MKIHQIFFVGDSQEEIFFLCRDHSKVNKSKGTDFFSRARLEEVFAKLGNKKNAIVVVSFSKKNWDQDLLVRLLEKIKEINPKNIILGIGNGNKHLETCDVVLNPQQTIVEMGEENFNLLKDAGFEPAFFPITRFFSNNLGNISREKILNILHAPIDWEGVPDWVQKNTKKRA